ncbi:hypothetical protein T552_03442 [Pneumocystis carinii B80]|uniref:Rab-GAP TBC domain-containing protein n=1 Tax=Pneumocystis carinii (strain B80) TaxID=1408658 RepID=A0A0W4ZB58_PNEC8|nr:hypothetical protein T552_03442 [Pneumocystis carinii B80]KTW25581.1 hypothetical protein T552_03442 [Pneumocystis carinii B80]
MSYQKKIKLNDDENNIFIISHAILENDFINLKKYGSQGYSFINNKFRKKIWKILICPEDKKVDSKIDWKLLPVHKDENQVQLDVNRSFIYYPKNLSNHEIKKKRNELNSLIVEILRKHPNLNYFQGYHDIAQVFLLCIGRKEAFKPLELLSLTRIRDFFLPSLSPILDHLEFIKLIVQKKDQELGKHIANVPSHFALASYLTWFSHEIKHLKHILKIFDFIISTDTAMVLYIYAAIIIQKKKEIMIIDKDDIDILHKFLNDLSQECHTKDIFRKSISLREEIPLRALPNWKYIMKYSFLKDSETIYNLEYASKLYYMEIIELRKSKLHQYIFTKNILNKTILIATVALFSVSIAYFKKIIKSM